jgi:hypothetical protein
MYLGGDIRISSKTAIMAKSDTPSGETLSKVATFVSCSIKVTNSWQVLSSSKRLTLPHTCMLN